MKLAALTCLMLAVAGAYAIPQPVSQEIETLAESRIFDIWFIGFISRVVAEIQERGLDKVDIPEWTLYYRLWDGAIEVIGKAYDIRFKGLADIVINEVNYNMLFGILSFDISIPLLDLEIGKYHVTAAIGDFRSNLEISGKVALEGLGVSGNVVLSVQGGHVTIVNTNVFLNIKDSRSDLVVITDRDVSCCVNTFFNRRLQEHMYDYRDELSVVMDRVIRMLFSNHNNY